MINLIGGNAIIGIKAISWPWCLRVREASFREPGKSPVPMDGCVMVPLKAVQFAQITG